MVEKPTGCDRYLRVCYIWYQSLWLSDNHGSVEYYSLEIESVVLQNEFECNNRYERVFVSEYKLFYIMMIGLLSGIWILVNTSN